ncbi:hypothetical protein [Streptomyces sp. NPDC005538]|uniref:hypothetical protein n=1 Tax=unclassified Streptomyces TaxID=2593676 RepID=UPI0033B4F419
MSTPDRTPQHHLRPDPVGAGYLHHCMPAHQDYHRRLTELGARIDMVRRARSSGCNGWPRCPTAAGSASTSA